MITFNLKRINGSGLEGYVTLPKGISGILKWKNREIKLSGETQIYLK